MEFPTNLADFITTQAGWSVITSNATLVSPDMIDVVRLLVDCDVVSCMPAAFLALSQADLGVRLESRAGHQSLLSLPASVLIPFLKGRDHLLSQQLAYHLDWAAPSLHPPDCIATRPECMQAKLNTMCTVHTRIDGVLRLDRWRESRFRYGRGLCAACIKAGKTHHAERMQALWQAIPSFFGLPPWETILQSCKYSLSFRRIDKISHFNRMAYFMLGPWHTTHRLYSPSGF